MSGSPPRPEPTCYRHPDRITYVTCARCDRPICGEDQIPASVGFHCPEDVRAAHRGARAAKTAYGGRLGGRGQVTRALVALNVGVFVLTLLGGAALLLGEGSSPLYELFSMQPVTLRNSDGTVSEGIVDGEYYRLLTSMFLHYGTLHLLLNMFALVQLGPELERVLGGWRFLALYLLTGLAGSATSYAFGPENVRAAGASGAIFGLAGAWLVLNRRRREDLGPILAFLVLGIAIAFVPGLAIDWRAHLGGFVAGAGSGAVLFVADHGGQRQRNQVLGLVAIGLVVVALVVVRTLALQDG